jgi:hypothetical protein
LRLKSSADQHERNRPNDEHGKSENQTSSLREKSIHTQLPICECRLSPIVATG